MSLAGFASLAQAAEVSSADQVAAGRDFASRVCGACHVVTQRRDELAVLAPPRPSFAVLAQRPLLTEQALREFLPRTTATWARMRRCPTRALRTIRSTNCRVHDVAEGGEVKNPEWNKKTPVSIDQDAQAEGDVAHDSQTAIRPVPALFPKSDPKTGKRDLGTFKSRAAAEKHEREVQYFKRH